MGDCNRAWLSLSLQKCSSTAVSNGNLTQIHLGRNRNLFLGSLGQAKSRQTYWIQALNDIFVVQLLSHVQLFVIPWTAARQASLSLTISQSLLNSCPLSQWCNPTMLSSVIPFSSCLQSFPGSGSFPMSQFFESSGQIIGVSVSSLVLPMNTQDWLPVGLTLWVSFEVQGTLKCLLQYHSSKASIFQHSAFFRLERRAFYISCY